MVTLIFLKRKKKCYFYSVPFDYIKFSDQDWVKIKACVWFQMRRDSRKQMEMQKSPGPVLDQWQTNGGFGAWWIWKRMTSISQEKLEKVLISLRP